MENSYTYAELNIAIELLESEKAIKGQLLQKQFGATLNSLNPLKLLGKEANSAISNPDFIETILVNILGTATGYLSKKLVVGGSNNVLRRIMGSLLQAGAKRAIMKNADTIKHVGHFLIQILINKMGKSNSNSRKN